MRLFGPKLEIELASKRWLDFQDKKLRLQKDIIGELLHALKCINDHLKYLVSDIPLIAIPSVFTLCIQSAFSTYLEMFLRGLEGERFRESKSP